MTKSTAHSRRQRNAHTHDEQPDKTAFFSKASKEHTQQKTKQPFFQTKLATPVEDEKLGTNDARMAKDKEIQKKPIQRTATDPEQSGESKIQSEVEETASENEQTEVSTNKTQRCDMWETDPQSFSIRAAQNFCKDAFNVSVSTPETVNCSATSCVVNYNNGGFNIKLIVDMSSPGTVSVSGTAAPFILRPKLCSYRYSCDDSGSIRFTRISCQLI
jgi:hypothetical protein